jgi:hypothetical protein
MAITWKRSNEIVWEELDGEALLVSPVSGARWSLNAAAAAVWKCCDGTRSLAALSSAFAQASGLSLREARQEIAMFCQRFSELGLLHAQAQLVAVNTALTGPTFHFGMEVPAFKALGLGHGPRRRPSPRGNSGPG